MNRRPPPCPDFADDVDLELRLARFEQLISRRPLLLNSVLLRQNPHHVHEWHKRVALHQGRPREVCDGPASRACLGPPSSEARPLPTRSPPSLTQPFPDQPLRLYLQGHVHGARLTFLKHQSYLDL